MKNPLRRGGEGGVCVARHSSAAGTTRTSAEMALLPVGTGAVICTGEKLSALSALPSEKKQEPPLGEEGTLVRPIARAWG